MCEECYSEDSRATPLRGARACLEGHTQYICGGCGRCICIEREERRGLQRWNFPFQTLEQAELYLRAADHTRQRACGIYQIEGPGGRTFYKIFPGREELAAFLRKNPGKRCPQGAPLFSAGRYREFPGTQVRRLRPQEVEAYLAQR